jgi:hypothetical protein
MNKKLNYMPDDRIKNIPNIDWDALNEHIKEMEKDKSWMVRYSATGRAYYHDKEGNLIWLDPPRNGTYLLTQMM